MEEHGGSARRVQKENTGPPTSPSSRGDGAGRPPGNRLLASSTHKDVLLLVGVPKERDSFRFINC